MGAHEEEQVMCASARASFNYGESEDPAKMTYSKMALIKRDLLATAASKKSQSVGKDQGSVRLTHERMQQQQQQHARSWSATSGRILDRPSANDPVQREQRILF